MMRLEARVEDVRAAMDWLANEFRKPLVVAGFSFGSYVGMRAACGDERVAGLIALGLPVQAAGRNYTYEFLRECMQARLFVSGDHDEFCPEQALDAVLEGMIAPWDRFIVPGADHFFQGILTSPDSKLEVMQGIVSDWLIHRFGLKKVPV